MSNIRSLVFEVARFAAISFLGYKCYQFMMPRQLISYIKINDSIAIVRPFQKFDVVFSYTVDKMIEIVRPIEFLATNNSKISPTKYFFLISENIETHNIKIITALKVHYLTDIKVSLKQDSHYEKYEIQLLRDFSHARTAECEEEYNNKYFKFNRKLPKVILDPLEPKEYPPLPQKQLIHINDPLVVLNKKLLDMGYEQLDLSDLPTNLMEICDNNSLKRNFNGKKIPFDMLLYQQNIVGTSLTNNEKIAEIFEYGSQNTPSTTHQLKFKTCKGVLDPHENNDARTSDDHRDCLKEPTIIVIANTFTPVKNESMG